MARREIGETWRHTAKMSVFFSCHTEIFLVYTKGTNLIFNNRHAKENDITSSKILNIFFSMTTCISISFEKEFTKYQGKILSQ